VINNEGVRILDAVRRMRRFHADVAELLRECEARILAEHWQPVQASDKAGAEKSGVTWSVSKNIEEPDRWLPQFANRAYRRGDKPSLMPFVNVIWDLVYHPALLQEPMVTAGWVDYSPHVAQWTRVGDAPLMHMFLPNRRDNGEFVRIDGAMWQRLPASVRGKLAASRAATMGLPLTSVTRATLGPSVIDPLIQELSTL